MTGEDGDTNLNIQLWDSEGRQERLIQEVMLKSKCLNKAKMVFKALMRID